jgi:hypothetical protein
MEATKIDLIEAKKWSPKPELLRFYFGDNKYIQCNSFKGAVYYKVVGIDNIVNMDEVISQICFYMSTETNRVFPSKF